MLEVECKSKMLEDIIHHHQKPSEWIATQPAMRCDSWVAYCKKNENHARDTK